MEETEMMYLSEKDGLHPDKSYKVLQVFIKCTGGPVYSRQRICELNPVDEAVAPTNGQSNKAKSSVAKGKLLVKSSMSGTVGEILLKVGQVVTIGSPMLKVSVCKHPTMLGNMCGDCGVTFEENDDAEEEQGELSRAPVQHKTVSMLHSMPNLRVTVEEAERLGAADRAHLLETKKLVLLVDLDQTLLHTTNDNVPLNIKDVHHFKLHPHGPVYHCRLRPFTRRFLASVSELYELHICTFGVREYAHVIARYLDPDGKLFQQRILSRNECLDPMSKKANLKSLFPCGDELVCIMDDRSDVWHFAPNVVQVLPYHFFQHTGDINAPPGLQKKDHDATHAGFDFSALGEEVTKRNSHSKDRKNKQPKGDGKKKLDPDKASPSVAGNGSSSSSSSTTYSDDDANSVASDDAPSSQVVAEVKSPSEPASDLTGLSPVDAASSDSRSKCSDDRKTPPGSEEDLAKEVLSDKGDSKTVEDDGDRSGESLKDDRNNDGEKTSSLLSEATNTDVDVSRNLPNSNTEENENASTNNKTTECTDGKNSSQDSSTCKEEEEEQVTEDVINSTGDVIDVPDHDDYLLHLEDILRKIHQEFYARYRPAVKASEESQSRDPGFLPDLKWLVPEIRGSVLKDCCITFSSVVPQNSDLRSSKAYGIAVCLGARVSEELVLPPRKGVTTDEGNVRYTTHLVAANPHTQKVHQARHCKSVMVVTPDWLWCCMERWEKVEELLFPLTPSSIVTRNPPHHCCAPHILPNASRQNSLDLYFMEDQAKESMMEEVEELLGSDGGSSEGSSSSGESDEKSSKRRKQQRSLEGKDESNSSNDDSNTGDSSRLQHKRSARKRRRRQLTRRIGPSNDGGLYDDDENSVNFDQDDDDDDELPRVKFRRGEAVRGVRRDSEDDNGGEDVGGSSSNSSDMEALDSGEEERLLKMEEELMDS